MVKAWPPKPNPLLFKVMSIKLLNVVHLAEDFESLLQWYKDALDLEVIYEEKGEYHYTELGYDKKVIVGIAIAKEMEHVPTNPRNNTSIMQLSVSDINATFNQIKAHGGKVLFGPSYEEQNKFYYGGVTDIEGNQIWFTQTNK